MGDIIIRQYKSADKEQVIELHKRALQDIGAYVTSSGWDKDLYDIEGVYIQNKGEFLVGLLDNKIIAMGAFKKISDTIADLKRMRVHPDFQKQGFGKKILETLEKRAKELGYQTIQLDTMAKQIAARSFYEKNGYNEIRKETWDIQGNPTEIFFYQKKL